MAKIHEYNPVYSFLRPYVDSRTRLSYRKTATIGLERIPKDGAIIFAPNHSNALMDALNVLRSRKGATVFGARADLFKRKPIAAIMTMLRILPMVRERDGIRNVLGNLETMNTISEALADGTPFCVFCEGTHRTMHSLLPIKKGIFRTAWTTLDQNPGKKVYIVPVGLEYGDYFRYRSTCLMEFGEPLDFGDFVDNHDNMPQGDIYLALAKELKDRMSKLITYIPDNEDYEAKWALIKMICAEEKGSLEDRRKENRKIAEIIEDYLTDESREHDMRALLTDVLGFDKKRQDMRISSHSFSGPKIKGLLKLPFVVSLLPFWLICALFTMPVWATSWIVCSKTEDTAFHNSLRAGFRIVLSPLTFLIWVILGAAVLPFAGWKSLLILIFFAVAYSGMLDFFYDYKEFARRTISDVRLLFNNKDLRKERERLIKRFLAI